MLYDNREDAKKEAESIFNELPLFKKDITCSKCTFGYITVRCERITLSHYKEIPYQQFRFVPPREISFHVMKRECPQCGFSWNERPLDSEGNNNND